MVVRNWFRLILTYCHFWPRKGKIKKKKNGQTGTQANFCLNIFIHISIYSNIQIYILQYNHDGIQKKSLATYTNLFPFEHKGA